MNSLGDMGRGGFGMGAHSAGRQRKSNKRKKKSVDLRFEKRWS